MIDTNTTCRALTMVALATVVNLMAVKKRAASMPSVSPAPERVPEGIPRERDPPDRQVRGHHDPEEQEPVGEEGEGAHIDDLGDHARSAPGR